MIAQSFCHGVPLFPQPLPKRNPGGDCFACAVSAAMRFFFPDNPPTFDQVWESFQSEQTHASGETFLHLNNTWPGMRQALWNLYSSGWRIEILADVVTPQYGQPEAYSYSWGGSVSGYDWARRLDGWLRAGYLAFSEIKFDAAETGKWYVAADGRAYRNHSDHFVLYDGIRFGWRKHHVVEGASSLVYQVHVVCSSGAGRSYWIDVDDLLRKHGAGGWWLIRPDQRSDLPETSA